VAAASSAAFFSAAAWSAVALSASLDMTMMKRTWAKQKIGGEQSRT
jgi:hypothetical protein